MWQVRTGHVPDKAPEGAPWKNSRTIAIDSIVRCKGQMTCRAKWRVLCYLVDAPLAGV